MREDFDQEKKRAVNVATRSLERDLERLKADHATEMDALIDSHKREFSEIKKKQWVIRNFAFLKLMILTYPFFPVLLLWNRGYLLVLLEYSILFNQVPTGSLA